MIYQHPLPCSFEVANGGIEMLCDNYNRTASKRNAQPPEVVGKEWRGFRVSEIIRRSLSGANSWSVAVMTALSTIINRECEAGLLWFSACSWP